MRKNPQKVNITIEDELLSVKYRIIGVNEQIITGNARHFIKYFNLLCASI